MTSGGEADLANLLRLRAWLYDRMSGSAALERQFKEIALDLAYRITTGRLPDEGTGSGHLPREIHALTRDVELFGQDISSSMVENARQNL